MGKDDILYCLSRLAAECLCLVIVFQISDSLVAFHHLHLCDRTGGTALRTMGICLSSSSPYGEGHGTQCDATLRRRE